MREDLNKGNLVALGAETLADLLFEAVKGDAARHCRVSMVLSADQGPEAIRPPEVLWSENPERQCKALWDGQ
ncbi:DUF6880 family protein [Roseivivax sediminis]|uniref:DUF6880 family protein n=1 Tax=Roseivivax sediminis TaxID=936889 RepID=UPI003742B3C9